MESNNNNGRGIFYGVIGVATLVVAIIGATFAYFTASVTRNNAITNVQATTLSLNIINEKNNFRTDMIPVDADGNGSLFKTFPSLAAGDGLKGSGCRDLVGNSICSVYEFTIENPSETVAQTVVGSLKVVTNGFTNLRYALFKGADSAIAGEGKPGYNVDLDPEKTAVTTNNWVSKTPADAGDLIHKGNFATDADGDGIIKWGNTLEQLAAKETTTYTIVVWLEEAAALNDPEQGKTFTASITFASESGSGVTGVLTASA